MLTPVILKARIIAVEVHSIPRAIYFLVVGIWLYKAKNMPKRTAGIECIYWPRGSIYDHCLQSGALISKVEAVMDEAVAIVVVLKCLILSIITTHKNIKGKNHKWIDGVAKILLKFE